ncbi:hypothetical protein FACS1894110_06970 [Spirochaetia bacterium]|nr:hypothetical protein FACS1894110_06970 [Spirochaetia bacterium]
MDTTHRFGGHWTITKLNILSDYLNFYVTALKDQPFHKIYIDAFAGTGSISIGNISEIIQGSARLALNAINKFNRYIFIEKNKKYAAELNNLVSGDYQNISDIIQVINNDCNDVLKDISEKTDWVKNRAVLFLDPYSTELRWETLEIIAKTKAIDVWYLFPLSAANRMLKKDGNIDLSWKARLNTIFGDTGWEQKFYKTNPQQNLFDNEYENIIKDANIATIKEYIYGRLKTIFPGVSDNPRVLYNSKNSPLFLFCFAVANKNPKAIGLAMKVANHILTRDVSK